MPSHACFQPPEYEILQDPISLVEPSAAVFRATVVAMSKDTYEEVVQLRVRAVWKGELASTISLRNDLTSTCSREIQMGWSYLFYATLDDDSYSVIGTFVEASEAREAMDALDRHFVRK